MIAKGVRYALSACLALALIESAAFAEWNQKFPPFYDIRASEWNWDCPDRVIMPKGGSRTFSVTGADTDNYDDPVATADGVTCYWSFTGGSPVSAVTKANELSDATASSVTCTWTQAGIFDCEADVKDSGRFGPQSYDYTNFTSIQRPMHVKSFSVHVVSVVITRSPDAAKPEIATRFEAQVEPEEYEQYLEWSAEGAMSINPVGSDPPACDITWPVGSGGWKNVKAKIVYNGVTVCADGAPCAVVELDYHHVQHTAPEDTDLERTSLGIGEKVDFQTRGGVSVEWMLDGDGALYPAGSFCTYRASINDSGGSGRVYGRLWNGYDDWAETDPVTLSYCTPAMTLGDGTPVLYPGGFNYVAACAYWPLNLTPRTVYFGNLFVQHWASDGCVLGWPFYYPTEAPAIYGTGISPSINNTVTVTRNSGMWPWAWVASSNMVSSVQGGGLQYQTDALDYELIGGFDTWYEFNPTGGQAGSSRMWGTTGSGTPLSVGCGGPFN